MLNIGGLAPGMNAAAAAAVRLGLHRGHTMLGVHGASAADRRATCRSWSGATSTAGPASAAPSSGSAGDARPSGTSTPSVAAWSSTRVDGLLIIGGWDAFEAAHTLTRERERYPAFQIPNILLPATIDNNIPGTELRSARTAPST